MLSGYYAFDLKRRLIVSRGKKIAILLLNEQGIYIIGLLIILDITIL